MPSTLTFPGVYVEELPSGVRTIVGVATSIAAFIGQTARGPLNTPTTINSFGDFERQFGGLTLGMTLGFAVNDFYQNGGSQAVIVRVFEPSPPTAKYFVTIPIGAKMKFRSASPGVWGKALRLTVTKVPNSSPSAFDLKVTDTAPGGATENYFELTLANGPRRVDQILAKKGAESKLLRYVGTLGVDDLGLASDSVTDGATTKETDLKAKQAAQAAPTRTASQAAAKLAAAKDAKSAADTALTNANKTLTTATNAATAAGQKLTDAGNAATQAATDQKNAADALKAAQDAKPQVPDDIKKAQKKKDDADQAKLKADSDKADADAANTDAKNKKDAATAAQAVADKAQKTADGVLTSATQAATTAQTSGQQAADDLTAAQNRPR